MKIKGWYAIITQEEVEAINNSTQLSIYWSIKSFCANGKRTFDVSIRDIKLRSHLSIGTISKNLPKVIDNGYVKVVGQESRRGGMVDVYKCLLAEQIKQKSVHNKDFSVQGVTSNRVQNNKVIKENNSSSKEMPFEIKAEIFAALGGNK